MASFVFLSPVSAGFHVDTNRVVIDSIDLVPIDFGRSWEAIDDPVEGADDDVGFIVNTLVSGATFTFKMTDFQTAGAQNVDTITSVKIVARMRRQAAGGGANPQIKLVSRNNDISVTAEGTTTFTISNTDFLDFSETFTTNPATGSAWLRKDFDAQNVEFGTRQTNLVTPAMRLTSLYLEVVYNPIPWGRFNSPGTTAWAASGKGAGGWVAPGPPSTTWTKS